MTSELSRHFRQCFNETVAFVREVRTVKRDLSEKTKPFDVLVEEVAEMTKEVD